MCDIRQPKKSFYNSGFRGSSRNGLAPLPFLLYINDLPSRIQSKVKLYADDVLLYSNIESDCQILQENLDTLVQWAHTWEMEFNYQKCEFLRVTNKQYPVIYN